LLGEAEIQNLRLAARRDEKIGGLDVAMNDACRVRRVQRVGNLNDKSSSSSNSMRPASMRCFSVAPSRNSIAMKGWPLCSPIS